ncbi:MAG: hypothetical protein V1806_03790 [Pseudomonadota bacterium]
MAVDPSRQILIPKTFANHYYTTYTHFYGGSIYILNATTLRAELSCVGPPYPAHTHYADLITLARKPKSIQTVAGGASPQTIQAVNPDKYVLIPLIIASSYTAGIFRPRLLSPAQIELPTTYANACRWLIIDP